jgi:TusA-related sulfurtransferase
LEGGIGKMSVIDCRGLACPQPVITTKQALDQLKEGELVVIVDNASSCSNVERFAKSQGCQVEVERIEQDFSLHIHKASGKNEEKTAKPDKNVEKVVVYINSHLLGGGDEALGSFLMKAFLKTLLDFGQQWCPIGLRGFQASGDTPNVVGERSGGCLLRNLHRFLWVGRKDEGRRDYQYV